MDKILNEFSVKFYSVGTDEVAIFNEIFNLDCYALRSKQDLIVMDIGMNVGLASLYFSKLPNVQKIYSYEPFKETYNLAIENIDLNPELKDKIITHNFGLGDVNENLLGMCNPLYRGSASIIDGISPTGDSIEVILKSAGNELEKIITLNPDMPIALKIDCEGGEIKIFKDSKFLSLLPFVKEIVMETHTPDIFKEITSILKNAGFSITRRMLSQSNGYIKALKKY